MKKLVFIGVMILLMFIFFKAEGATVDKDIFTIGNTDGSSNEFVDFNRSISNYKIPLTQDSTFPKGMKASINPKIDITYNLDYIPDNGLLFSFKTTDADMSTPQLAVYSNGSMAGLVQIAGTNGSGGKYPFQEIYQVYIPKNFLSIGNNTLTLEAYGGIYMSNISGNTRVWWTWDYLNLKVPDSPVTEPINGRNIHLGSSIFEGFGFTQNAIKLTPELSKWLGTAYSGNFTRVGLHSDTKSAWEKTGTPYLETLKDLNIEPLVMIFGADQFNSSDMQAGLLPTSVRNYFFTMMDKYGSLFQYLELDNEPGLFNHNQQSLVKLAEFINEQTPNTKSDLKLVAPGWAYWASNGSPYGWERNPEYRKQIEDLTVATNGHSYGTSGTTQGRGGSLNENLLTFNGNITKDFFMSEVGSNDSHMDSSKLGVDNYRFASSFDRELRGDIGSADHIIQHAAFFPANPSYSLFKEPINWKTSNINEIQAWASNANEIGETRLKTFRRLSAAYATHGSPLDFEIANESDLVNKKIYVRAIDTSSLGKSAIGASANKLIISLVNFEPIGSSPITVQVKVKMPTTGSYIAERYDSQDTYSEAYKELGTLDSSPYLTFKATLKSGDTTMIYLTPKENIAPTIPTNLIAQAISYDRIDLSWITSTDETKLKGYRIFQNGVYLDYVPRSLNTYTDYNVSPSKSYTYTIQAVDESGNYSTMSMSSTAITHGLTITPGGPIYEAEKATLLGSANIQNSTNASNGKLVGNLHCIDCGIKIENISPGEGLYNLNIRYASTLSSLTLYVNNEKIRTINFPSTGSVSKFDDVNFTINLKDSYNTIKIVHLGNDLSGTNIDYIKLTKNEIIDSNKWIDIPFNDENLLYSSKIYTDDNSYYKNSDNKGDFITYDFNGTGFKWYSNIKNDSGIADIYIDGELIKTVDLVSAGLEGTNKLVYEVTNLTEGNHRVKIANQTDKTISFNGFSLYGKNPLLIKIEPSIVEFIIDSITNKLSIGEKLQLNTKIIYDTGITQNANSITKWSSNNLNIATIDEKGLVSLNGEGSVNISAVYSGLSQLLTLIIEGKTSITGFLIEPVNTTFNVGEKIQLVTTIIYNTGENIKDNSLAKWESNNLNVATVDENGLVSFKGEGSVTITAKYQDFSESVTLLSKIKPSVTGFIMEPSMNNPHMGDNLQLNTTIVYDSGEKTNGNSTSIWTSNNVKIATVDTNGLVSFIEEGTVTITAKYAGISKSATFTVTPNATNIALNKPAIASSSLFGDNAKNAVDGSYDTRWQSNYSDNEWIYIDLGKKYNLNAISIDFLYHRAKNYEIQISDDTINWRTIQSITNGTGSLDKFDFTNTNGRYVKLNLTLRASSNYVFNIQDIRIYGEEYVAPKNTTINNALGKKIITSSAYFGDVGANVVDGKMETRWQSAYTDFEYLYVDLEKTYSINKIDLRFLYHRASRYNIYISDDAINWTQIETIQNKNDSVDEFTYENAPIARYVKLEFTYRLSRNYVFNLQEFEIYGDLIN